jgi:predicted transcriptional regulator
MYIDLVTKSGPIDDNQALGETVEILADPHALAAVEDGLAEIERGETVTLDELRSELAERRPAAG